MMVTIGTLAPGRFFHRHRSRDRRRRLGRRFGRVQPRPRPTLHRRRAANIAYCNKRDLSPEADAAAAAAGGDSADSDDRLLAVSAERKRQGRAMDGPVHSFSP